MNNKLPQAKFESKAKKTVGFVTKKEIEFDKNYVGTEVKIKQLKKAKSEKIILIDKAEESSDVPLALGSKNKIKLAPL